jgi:hypothetical protein
MPQLHGFEEQPNDELIIQNHTSKVNAMVEHTMHRRIIYGKIIFKGKKYLDFFGWSKKSKSEISCEKLK